MSVFQLSYTWNVPCLLFSFSKHPILLPLHRVDSKPFQGIRGPKYPPHPLSNDKFNRISYNQITMFDGSQCTMKMKTRQLK
jgi:hypothetical protein